MRFLVTGANRDTGADVEFEILALTTLEAEQLAASKGIMISAIKEIKPKDVDETPIELEPDLSEPAPAKAASAGSTSGGSVVGRGVSLQTGQPEPIHHAGDSHHPESSHASVAGVPHDIPHAELLQYKVVINQSLMLLESSVNKYLKDGWEPSGGMTVGMQNLAMVYFQALIRRPGNQPAGHDPAHDGHAAEVQTDGHMRG
jgi:hypothetical protein